MSRRSHFIDSSDLVATAELAGLVVLARLAVPAVLTWLTNRVGKRVPGFKLHVGRVEVELLRPSLIVRGLQVAKLNDGALVPLANVDTIRMASDWRQLLQRRLVGTVLINEPRIAVDLRQFPAIRTRAETRATKNQKQLDQRSNSRPTNGKQISEQLPDLQDRIKRLPSIKLASGILRRGDIRVAGIPDLDGIDLHVSEIDAAVENLTNYPQTAETAVMHIACTARVMDSGQFLIRAEGYPLVFPPIFDVDLSMKRIDLTPFRPLVPRFVPIDLQRGFADLFFEAAAAHGNLKGYAKPMVDHLELATLRHRGPLSRIKGWMLKAGARMVRNKATDRIATRVDFEGAYDHPQVQIGPAIRRILRNAFRTPERSLLDNSVWLAHVGPRATDAELQYLGDRPNALDGPDLTE